MAGLLLWADARADTLPVGLRGSWRIARILPTSNVGCWTAAQGRPLLGSMLTYSSRSLRWKGGTVPLQGILSRQVDSEEFAQENMGSDGYKLGFAELGIRAKQVTEVDLQHEDSSVLPASTAVPGDVVLMVGPQKIVVSACGVYFEAIRARSER